jgi:phage-related tail protein
VKELTDEEKKQALVNAVIEQGKKELAEAGEVQLTTQEKIARLNATRENTKNTIGDALIPVFDKLLTKITPIIEKVADWIEKNPELTANILMITTAVA